MLKGMNLANDYNVAPARERGLKCRLGVQNAAKLQGRSRKEAWIENDIS